MPVSAMGPTYAGGEEPLLHEQSGYRLTFLPDVNNWELQRAGEAPVFYWIPSQIRLARKNGPDSGDYLFNLTRFSGVQGPDTTVGAEEQREVAGGVCSFTITSAPPDAVLQELQQQIIAKYQSQQDFFWGIRSQRPPIFRPAIITSNNTTIANVAPLPGGAIPTPTTEPGARGRPGPLVARGNPIRTRAFPGQVKQGAARDASNLDPWVWQMTGEGAGSISPSGQNAYSALLGAYPTAILWAACHGTTSLLTVNQALMLKAWSPVVELTIHGEWSKIFEHFSAAFEAHYLFASVDVKAELNKMRMKGTIEVDLKIDSTIPGGDKILENIEKRSDLVFDKFMEEARKVIFEPPAPQVEAAQTSGGKGYWGVGLALKYRRDETNLVLHYHEKRQLAYLQQHVISSSLTGMFEELKADPDAERKYFMTVSLDDWPRKLARIVKPVCNWADGAVSYLSADIGYPNQAGEVMWTGHLFQQPGSSDDSWKYAIGQKALADVQRPPADWTPDKTFVRRAVGLNEPPSEIEDPYKRVQVDQNRIELDPGPSGTLLSDVTLEVRADSAGRLAVGPIQIGAVLAEGQTVHAVFEPTDDNGRSTGRTPVRFSWSFEDQNKDRIWLLFTGDPAFRSFFRYQVRVLVKGTIFEPGMEWTGPWVPTAGNGPITLSIPQRDAPGVTVVRSMPEFRSKSDALREPYPVIEAQGEATSNTTARPQVPRPGPGSVDSPSFQGWSVPRSRSVGTRDSYPD